MCWVQYPHVLCYDMTYENTHMDACGCGGRTLCVSSTQTPSNWPAFEIMLLYARTQTLAIHSTRRRSCWTWSPHRSSIARLRSRPSTATTAFGQQACAHTHTSKHVYTQTHKRDRRSTAGRRTECALWSWAHTTDTSGACEPHSRMSCARALIACCWVQIDWSKSLLKITLLILNCPAWGDGRSDGRTNGWTARGTQTRALISFPPVGVAVSARSSSRVARIWRIRSSIVRCSGVSITNPCCVCGFV